MTDTYNDNNLITTEGTVIFDPFLTETKNFKPFWSIVKLGEKETNELPQFYAWLIKKRFRIKVHQSLWGAHVSLTRGEETDKWEEVKQKYHNKNVSLSYSPDLRTNGKHWWAKVYSDDLENIRTELGLTKQHDVSLHLTIGMVTPAYLNHSLYILETCKKFDL